MKAMILAAGKGTRLGELTRDTPKPLLPIAGRPLLSYTLALLREVGVEEVVVNLHHCAEKVRAFSSEACPRFGMTVTYSVEEQLLGTAGAVKRAERFFQEPFLVVYGDNLLDVDLRQLVRLHEASDAHCTIGLYRAPDPSAVGVVELGADRRVLRFVEKPRACSSSESWANAGLYMLDPKLLPTVPAGVPVDFGYDMFPRWLSSGARIFGCPLSGLVQDIGTPEGYRAAEAAVTAGQIRPR